MAIVRLDSVDEISRKLGIQEGGDVQAYFTNACYRYMDKYVPKDTGALREVVSITNDSITYESPYAHAQYVGIVNGSPVQNYTTPNTGSYWDKRMMSAEKDDLIKEVADYAKRRNK